jgi:uncharacterized protein (DUF302 family)
MSSPPGLVTLPARLSPAETLDRLEAAVKSQGLTVFARIDHAAGAAAVDLSLRPTTVLIFGNARGGTPLLQANQLIGIDLPLRALVWQDAAGSTWISYPEPRWIAQRYDIPGAAAAGLAALIQRVATQAVSVAEDP